MKIRISIKCDDCGNYASFKAKRITDTKSDTGEVYEDYSSIKEGIGNNHFFSAKQYFEDNLEITCKSCGNKHDISM